MQLTLELKKAIENNAFCSIATYLENNDLGKENDHIFDYLFWQITLCKHHYKY